MKLIAVVTILVLAAIAAFHIYWAFGGLWPGGNERALIDTVIGDARFEAMPSRAVTLAVAGCLMVAALIALNTGFSSSAGWFAAIAAFGVGLVFLARGIAGYLFVQVAWAPVEPFATLNVWLYSPLCLGLGLFFIALAWRAIAKL